MRTRVHARIRPEYLALLTDTAYPKDGNSLWRLLWTIQARRLWTIHRDEVLADWVVRRPGTRPSSWWRFEMPLAQRTQLGEEGTFRPVTMWCGIPTTWSVDDFSYANPPLFESQAEFLKRLGLLLPSEESRLSDLDFLPEVLPKEWWPRVDY
jgi:hypothetical protein